MTSLPPDGEGAAQELLVRYATGVGLAPLDAGLCQATAERLTVYRQSFRSRVVTVLAGTLLAPLSRLVGEALVQEMLAAYFAAAAPTAAALSDSLAGFAAFIGASTEGPVQPLIQLMAEASLARWQLLTGPDPAPVPSLQALAPAAVRLKPCRLLSSHSGVRLYEAWTVALGGDLEAYTGLVASHLLLVKTSPTELLALSLDPTLQPLAALLAQGVPLQAAVAGLSPEASEAVEPSALAQLVGLLARGQALTAVAERPGP